MRVAPLETSALLLAIGLVACGTSSPPSDGSGGTASGATGGTTAAGGSSSGSGGTSSKGGSGGTNSKGGSTATGGSSTGGSSSGSGGAGGTGGSGGTGNAPCTDVPPTGTDWDEATCQQWAAETEECDQSWMVDNAYCNESCGRCSGNGSGGSSGGAGTGGTGGSSNGGSGPSVEIPPSNCTTGDLMVCNNQTQMHCGYTYEYWKDAGTGCMINTADGFSIDWSNVSNLLARKGIRPGSADLAVTFEADYQPVGNSYLNVYGWMRSPLVEYYIVDSWGDWRPPGVDAMATIESDGGTYDIYRTERVNAPTIEGNRDFPQFWSVRREKRNSGTITVGNHFDAWESNGMTLGSLYEVSLNVEGYQSSGLAHVRMLIQ